MTINLSQSERPVKPSTNGMLVLNIGTLVNVAQLLVILFGGIWAVATVSVKMDMMQAAVTPLIEKVANISTTTEIIKAEQKGLSNRVERIEIKIDNAAAAQPGR